ncbi:MAG: hypothetical protein J6T27_01470 [Alphaproteobacteria bacterium]|nr:hypothetical protein [Alphaproteobacteria bacterium]
MKKDKALRFIGGTLVVLGLGMEYIVASTDADYVNAPSRESVKNPAKGATFQEDIKSTENLWWEGALSIAVGVGLMALSKKQQSK